MPCSAAQLNQNLKTKICLHRSYCGVFNSPHEPSPNREVTLFSAALELPAGQRTAYLHEACADDPALRLRLEGLLRVHEKAIPFLETPAPLAQESPMGAEVPGATDRPCVSATNR